MLRFSAPWQLSKENNIPRLEAVMYVLVKVLLYSAFLLYPFMPQATKSVVSQLGIELPEERVGFDNLKEEMLKPGHPISKAGPLFPLYFLRHRK